MSTITLTGDQLGEIVSKAVREAVNPAAVRATPEQRQYLEERGWLEGDESGDLRRYGFLDMNPPPDRVRVTGTIVDEKTGKKMHDVEQLVPGGSIGQFHSLADALRLEGVRSRLPVAPYFVQECTGNPPYHKDFQPINLQKWYVRDRQRRVVAGPFDTKEEAIVNIPETT